MLIMTEVPENFRAVTWNVYSMTPVAKLEPPLQALLAGGVNLLAMQEAGGKDITRMLEAHGLQTFTHDEGQWRLAWAPPHWTCVDAEQVRLSSQVYQDRRGRDTYSEAVKAILCDRLGRSLTAVCYHAPAHIQGFNMPHRLAAAIESMQTLGDLADAAWTTGFWAGGDLNWDPDQGEQVEAMTAALAAGNLKVLDAPAPTLGAGRDVDLQHIVRPKLGGRLHRVGRGWVAPGGGDHKIHGEELRWVGP